MTNLLAKWLTLFLLLFGCGWLLSQAGPANTPGEG